MVSTPRPLPDKELERAAENAADKATHRARGTHDWRPSGSREERYQPDRLEPQGTATGQPQTPAAAP